MDWAFRLWAFLEAPAELPARCACRALAESTGKQLLVLPHLRLQLSGLRWATEHVRLDSVRSLIVEAEGGPAEGLAQALCWFAKAGCAEWLGRLLREGPSSTALAAALRAAAEQGRGPCLRRLLEASASVHAMDENDCTALHWAADKGHAEACKVLLAAGARLDDIDDDAWTPLCLAAEEGHLETCRVLLEAGQLKTKQGHDKVNLPDEDLRSPLWWAAWRRHRELAALLLSFRADPEQGDRHGVSPREILMDDALANAEEGAARKSATPPQSCAPEPLAASSAGGGARGGGRVGPVPMDRPEGAVLLSSGSRSAPINLRPGHALHEATLPLALLLQELLPQVRRRRRRRYEEKEAASEPAELDEAIGFWRSSRLAEHQISSSLLREGPEYFISHLWQPADQAQSRETYAEEKTALLKSWAITHKALLGEDRQIRTPWFLLETEQDRRMALLDPKNAWHNMRCWVDKACAHRGFPGAAPPQEALRATKAAMAHCRTFLAVLSHGGYFRRLWCCYEWAFFAARAAPHYRSLEVLLPESLQQPGPWKELLRSVAGFRLEELRCSGETMKLELWQDLKELAVDDDGFEGFVRATALALLTLQALLRQAETCAAFGSASLEAASEACEVAGLRGLGKILNTAQPMIWWRSAYRQQRTERQRMARGKPGEDPRPPRARSFGSVGAVCGPEVLRPRARPGAGRGGAAGGGC
ncbi:unnamed protein product [Effrenium voratum]|uniref:Uncharacterized protein n=1 Tax=Effrenium voratum TaxID=2562239 RepID=A0AA36MTD4_9DINO|nr:unnamed protein product [Effrenium voratum]